MKWYVCGSCLSEFRVVSDDADFTVEYCPSCGAEIEDEEDDEDDYEYDEDY